MTATDIPQRPDTHKMIVIHRVFRRESALLPRLVQSVPDGDVARARPSSQQGEIRGAAQETRRRTLDARLPAPCGL
jgi:hypothetical protein